MKVITEGLLIYRTSFVFVTIIIEYKFKQFFKKLQYQFPFHCDWLI